MSYPTFVRRGVDSEEEGDSDKCGLKEGGREREAGESIYRSK
jgi:hypothetical protein